MRTVWVKKMLRKCQGYLSLKWLFVLYAVLDAEVEKKQLCLHSYTTMVWPFLDLPKKLAKYLL